jgi:hypothetical protein
VARITVQEARAWAEPTKLKIDTLDADLLAHMEEEVLGQLQTVFDTSTWLDQTSTPKLVRTIISKKYVCWFYRKAYSEDTDAKNPYAQTLDDNANMLVLGLVSGTIEIPGIPAGDVSSPSFYPTDASSLLDPLDFPDDPSVGPAKFSMTTVF